MSDSDVLDVPFVSSILHPTDFSEASANAFGHALAVATRRQALITLLNVVKTQDETDWAHFPPVRDTLERWGLLKEGSDRAAVSKELGLKVSKVNMRHKDVRKAIDAYIDNHPVDFVVLATEQKRGLPRWIDGSVAEDVAREAGLLTLFVPEDATGIVSLETGEVSLRRILVPVDDEPDPQRAIVRAARSAQLADGDPVEIVLLHVGGQKLPNFKLPQAPNLLWDTLHRKGDVVEEILRAAAEVPADLIVMTTGGRDGILDAFRGSTTEQVVRRARCPLLAVPTSA